MTESGDVEKSESSTHSAPSATDAVPMEPLQPTETNNVRPACFKSTTQEVLFVLTATMSIGMTAILAGSVSVSSSYIGQDLNMTAAEITWIASATTLGTGAFLLFFGKVADLFGRKTMFIGSLFLFSVFSLAAGFAKTGISLDILNGILGLTSASAIPPASGILGVCYDKPSKRKNAAFACFSAGNPIGFVAGIIAGGIATSLLGWRSQYYFMAIVFLIFTVVGVFTVPQDFADKQPLNWETIKRFDIVGVLCVIFGIGMFSAALSLGDTAPSGWKTGYVLALLIVGFLLIVAFVVLDSYIRYPLVDLSIFKDRNLSLLLTILALGMAAFTPGSFFVALYFQNIWHLSALQVALFVLPMAIMGLIVNVIAGLVLHRVSNKILMGIGAGAYVICFLLFSLNRHDSSYWSFCFPAFMLLVVGADLEFNVAQMYVISSLPPSQQSIASGALQTVTKLAMTVGFGITTAVFTSVGQRPTLSPYWDVATQPYTATMFVSLACAVVSLCLVPFLTLKTQGHREKKTADDAAESETHGQSHALEDEKETAEASVRPELAEATR